MKMARKIHEGILKFVEITAVLLLVSIAIMLMIQIISRSLHIGLQWPEEMARFSFVGVVFLGSVIALARNKHIMITTLLDKLPGRFRNLFEILIQAAIALFCVMAIKGVLLTIQSAVGVHANSLEWFQYNYVYYGVLASLVLMVLEAAGNVIGILERILNQRGEEKVL